MSIIGELVKTTKFGGICVDEYNGNISLMSAWENREGQVKPNMCTVKAKDFKTGEIAEKYTALKIYLGSRDRAIEVLEELTRQLKGGAVGDEDIPF